MPEENTPVSELPAKPPLQVKPPLQAQTSKKQKLRVRPGRAAPKKFAKKPLGDEAKIKKEIRKKVELPPVKLFGRWDSNVEVLEPGLKAYMNLRPQMLPRSAGVYRRPFHKSKAHIAERLALHMLVPGHRGRKHEITSGKLAGGFMKVLSAIEKAFEIIEAKEKKNPVEVLVRALENAAAREEITSYQLGSIVARDAVITSPQRRVDKTLRNIAQGSYRSSFGKKKSIAEALAAELIAAYKNSNESHAIKERERIEREAIGAR